MAGAITTPYATLSFPQLFSPKPRAINSKPVYSCALLFSPEAQQTPEYKKMQAEVAKLAKEKFPNVNAKTLRLPFRQAGEKDYAGYEDGWTFINPWSEQKPGVVDVRLQDVLDPTEVWAGQLVRANVIPFSYDNSGNKGISFGLNHIQLVKRDAPRIDGRIAANKAFTALEDDEDIDSVL